VLRTIGETAPGGGTHRHDPSAAPVGGRGGRAVPGVGAGA